MDSAESDQDLITVAVDGKHFECKKSVLIKQSGFFQAMFASGMRESRESHVSIHDISPDLFQVILHFLENEDQDLDLSSNAASLFCCASLLQFDAVAEKCKDYLMNSLSPSNCLGVMHIGDIHAATALYNAARSYALWEFKQVVEGSEIWDLKCSVLLDYLNDPMLNVDSEIQVFRVIVRWIEHNEQKDELKLLFDVLRLSSLSQADFQEIKSHTIVKSDPALTDYFSTQRGFGRSSQLARKVPWTLCFTGGNSNQKDAHDNDKKGAKNATVFGVRLASLHSGSSDGPLSLKSVTQMPPKLVEPEGLVWGYGTCVIGHYLFLMGGEVKKGIRQTYFTDIHRYCSLTDRWSIVGSLENCRRHHSQVAWGDNIFVIGGFGRHRVLQSSAEKFDIHTREWQSIPSLSVPVYSAGATVCNGRLYVIKTDIETWAPGEDTWTTVRAPIPFQWGIHQALTIDCRIYLLAMHKNEVFEYNPEEKTCEMCGEIQDCPLMACGLGQEFYYIGSEQPKRVLSKVKIHNGHATEERLGHITVDQMRGVHSVDILPLYPKFSAPLKR